VHCKNSYGKVKVKVVQAAIIRDIKWISNLNLFFIVRLGTEIQMSSFANSSNDQIFKWKVRI
jgi:hypothetical protein